jgi:glucuronate isomerase
MTDNFTQTTLDDAREYLANSRETTMYRMHPCWIIAALVVEIEAERDENNRLRGEVEELKSLVDALPRALQSREVKP